MEADLNGIDPVFKGNVDLSSVQAGQLSSAFTEKASELITGSLQSSVNFAGTGLE